MTANRAWIAWLGDVAAANVGSWPEADFAVSPTITAAKSQPPSHDKHVASGEQALRPAW